MAIFSNIFLFSSWSVLLSLSATAESCTSGRVSEQAGGDTEQWGEVGKKTKNKHSMSQQRSEIGLEGNAFCDLLQMI